MQGESVTLVSIRKAARLVRVFGDDMIVPTPSFGSTVEALTHLRLKVNSAKTFGTGRFRESCGYDGFQGHDVTKVSILEAPSVSKPGAVLSLVDTANNLLIGGWEKCSAYVRSSVESLKRYRFPDVEPFSGSLGWYSYGGNDYSAFKRRWNDRLHRLEYLVLRPKGPGGKVPVERNSMVLQYFTEVTLPPRGSEIRLGEAPLRHPLKLRWVWAPIA
jgi:hypothetical protein